MSPHDADDPSVADGVLDPRAASDDATGEHRVVRAMLEATADDRQRRVAVWRPRRQVAFGQRDVDRPGYGAAREAAENAGFPATERTAGGHAVVHDGGTVAFAVAVPVAPADVAIRDRYCAVVDAVRGALAALGVAAAEGEPDGAFCPGDHGLRAGDGKVVGVAQRVRRESALVSGVVTVALSEGAVALYERLYDALDVPFDRDAVTDLATVAGAGGDGGPAPAAGAVADALSGALREA